MPGFEYGKGPSVQQLKPSGATEKQIPKYNGANWDVESYIYSELIGNGALTIFTITHNLNNVSVDVKITEESSGADVGGEITIIDENSITVSFDTPPSTDQFRVNIIG